VGRLIFRRLLAGIPILLILSFLVFVLVDLAPGDPAVQLAGENPTPELIRSIRAELHLDDPLPVRYVRWLGGAVHGDFGKSILTQQDVRATIFSKVPITLSIGLVAMAMSVVLGVLFGVLASLRPGSLLDRAITIFSSGLVAIPPFVLALVLIVQFAVLRQILPSIGYVKLTDDPFEWLKHLILPGIALSAYSSAETALQLRASLVETLGKDFILSARARGLASRSIVFRHAFKTAAIPIVTILGLRLGLILGGTAIMEQIFAINGVGALAISSTQGHDINTLLGIVMLVATIVLVVNVLVDISYGYLNPKMRVR
jgi:peptide/nickel transport system permease protein